MILALSCMSHDIDVLLSELILSHVPSLPTQCFPTLIGHEQWFDLEVAEGAVVRIVYSIPILTALLLTCA